MAPVAEVKMPWKEEHDLVYKVCPECSQVFMGPYVDRLCPKCRYKLLEKDKMLHWPSNIIGDSCVNLFLG